MTFQPAKSSEVLLYQPEGQGDNPPPSIRQVFHNVQVNGGDFNVTAGDLVQYHHHYYHSDDVDPAASPPLLELVPNLRKMQIATLGKAAARTGDWIYVWNEFCIWLAPDGHLRMLWGSGGPGVGKTVLTSLAIDAVETHARASSTPICIGFLYIRYSEDISLTVRDLLEVLVKQTIERHPACVPLCSELYARHVCEQTEPSAQELLRLLHRFASEVMSCTFYFLDAIDEAPEHVRRDLIEGLSSLPNVKLFITSRPLEAAAALCPDAHHFPIFARDEDLDIYIRKEVSRSMELQTILAGSSPGLRGRIASAIKKKANGVFLHASFHIDALRECMSTYGLEQTLEDFPPNIKGVYAMIWTRILKQPAEKVLLARSALAWVAQATRSLTVEELRHAVASCTDTFKFDPSRLAPIERLVDACCGLVIIEKESSLVRLVHYSAKDALQSLIPQVIPRPQSLLSAICIQKLIGAGLQRTTLTFKGEFEALLNSTPLLVYAYRSWFHHGRKSMDDPTAKAQLSRFVQGCQAFPVLPPKSGVLDLLDSRQVAAYFDLPSLLIGSG